jgi:protease-4
VDGLGLQHRPDHRRRRPQADAAALTKTLEAGPYGAEEARAGLIDRVGQAQEAAEPALLARRQGRQADRLRRLRGQDPPRRSKSGRRPVIAVIGAEGAIVTGARAAGSPHLRRRSTTSIPTNLRRLLRGTEDRDVKAIVFRVSSPGGSDTASEQILAAVRAAKAAGKPVVVSMGTYAASGGYWISSRPPRSSPSPPP